MQGMGLFLFVWQFTGCSLVDVDGIGADEVERLRRVAEEDAHTLFAHPTVSGKGLRILFRYALPEGYNLDTLLTTAPRQALLFYKEAFVQGNEYYKQRLGVSVTDGQCKNVTRLSCLAHCPDIRYHPDAQPLPITLPKERGCKRHKMGEKQFERVEQAVLKTLAQRAAYARNKEVRPHIASFCGTGNHLNFLTDLTGNRRWLPFLVENIDSSLLHPVNYTGLYSQALALWKDGFCYWFTHEDNAELELHNRQFEEPIVLADGMS